jgi:hypothetical protein
MTSKEVAGATECHISRKSFHGLLTSIVVTLIAALIAVGHHIGGDSHVSYDVVLNARFSISITLGSRVGAVPFSSKKEVVVYENVFGENCARTLSAGSRPLGTVIEHSLTIPYP